MYFGFSIQAYVNRNRAGPMNNVKHSFRVTDLRKRKFHIDVSREQPYVVQTDKGKEFPLRSLSIAELDHLMQFATRQLRQGVFDDHDALDELRATLYFLSRWSDRAKSHPIESGDRNAKLRRRVTAQDTSMPQTA